jgi:hypothetical protein
MGSRFLTENRWLLKLCAGVARFCGLLLLFGTGVLIAVVIVLMISERADLHTMVRRLDQFWTATPTLLFYGFLSLIFAEFISYLLAEQGEPKWILRHGDKIIYVYVPYSIVVSIQVFLPFANREEPSGMSFYHMLEVAFLAASDVMRILMWIGIAIMLRKLVPIIRESKTLV